MLEPHSVKIGIIQILDLKGVEEATELAGVFRGDRVEIIEDGLG
jgi:hypothetical protein